MRVFFCRAHEPMEFGSAVPSSTKTLYVDTFNTFTGLEASTSNVTIYAYLVESETAIENPSGEGYILPLTGSEKSFLIAKIHYEKPSHLVWNDFPRTSLWKLQDDAVGLYVGRKQEVNIMLLGLNLTNKESYRYLEDSSFEVTDQEDCYQEAQQIFDDLDNDQVATNLTKSLRRNFQNTSKFLVIGMLWKEYRTYSLASSIYKSKEKICSIFRPALTETLFLIQKVRRTANMSKTVIFFDKLFKVSPPPSPLSSPEPEPKLKPEPEFEFEFDFDPDADFDSEPEPELAEPETKTEPEPVVLDTPARSKIRKFAETPDEENVQNLSKRPNKKKKVPRKILEELDSNITHEKSTRLQLSPVKNPMNVCLSKHRQHNDLASLSLDVSYGTVQATYEDEEIPFFVVVQCKGNTVSVVWSTPFVIVKGERYEVNNCRKTFKKNMFFDTESFLKSLQDEGIKLGIFEEKTKKGTKKYCRVITHSILQSE